MRIQTCSLSAQSESCQSSRLIHQCCFRNDSRAHDCQWIRPNHQVNPACAKDPLYYNPVTPSPLKRSIPDKRAAYEDKINTNSHSSKRRLTSYCPSPRHPGMPPLCSQRSTEHTVPSFVYRTVFPIQLQGGRRTSLFYFSSFRH